MSDPNESLHRQFHIANIVSRNGPQSSPIKDRFICSDCGKSRLGADRYICQLCGGEVCDWCADKHIRQHPKESWK